MCAKIIDTRRYKTITKSQLEKKRKNNEKLLKSAKSSYNRTNKYTTSNDNSSFISNLRIRKHREKKIEQEMLLYSRPQRTKIKEPKEKVYIPKSFIITCCVLGCVLLTYTSIKIMKLDEKIATSTVFNNSDEQNEELKVELGTDYELSIGLLSFYETDVYRSTNLILNDLYKNISYSLVKIKDNYDIMYQVAKKIEKTSDTEYIVTLNDSYKLDIEDVKFSIDKIMEAGKENMYYDRVSNIASIDKLKGKNQILIKLYESNPYFIYNLDFPIIDNDEKVNSGFTCNRDSSSIIFERTAKNENKNLKSISIKAYKNEKEVVEDFSNGNVNVFFATSNNDMQLIGKNDYNVKKYKDGETLFILGNKDSEIFSKKEIRTALMYSLNREEIVKDSGNNFIEVIDLPFIYSTIKYKYDTVGAKNIMNANSWNRNSAGIYEKSENGKYLNATLKLLVNSEDEDKMKVAENIKSMARKTGLNIEIESLTQDEVNQKVEARDYDIVLASIYLEETPDIEFIKDYVNINDETAQAFLQVEQSSTEDIAQNIQNLEYVLSDEVACIGIYARNINLIYQKDIYGFSDINYMRIFSDLAHIGKIIG